MRLRWPQRISNIVVGAAIMAAATALIIIYRGWRDD